MILLYNLSKSFLESILPEIIYFSKVQTMRLGYIGALTHIFVKIGVAVLASKVNIPNFFQLIMNIYIKIDFLTP